MGFTDKYIEKINKLWADCKGFSADPAQPTKTQAMLADFSLKYPGVDFEQEADRIFYDLEQRFLATYNASFSGTDLSEARNNQHTETAQYVFDEGKKIMALMNGDEKDSWRFMHNVIRDAAQTFRRLDKSHTAIVWLNALTTRYEVAQK